MKPNHIILYIIVLACAFFGFDPKWGYMSASPWWSHITFHFAHGNIFHLAANMLVVFLLLFNRHDKWWLWLMSLVIASACSFAVATPKPTVGLSGMLFAYYGIIFMKDGMQFKPMLHTLLYLVVSSVFVSSFMAVGLHFLCLMTGWLVGSFMCLFKYMNKKVKLYD